MILIYVIELLLKAVTRARSILFQLGASEHLLNTPLLIMTDASDCDDNTVESVDMWDSPLSRLALNRPDNRPPVTDLPPVLSSGRKTMLSLKLRDCGNTLERTFNANSK